MVNIVAIPSRYQIELLTKLVKSLLKDEAVSQILVMDNGYKDHEKAFLDSLCVTYPSVTVVEKPGWSIYEMWNAAFLFAKKISPNANLALFNDDLTVPVDCISTLAKALEDDESLWVVSPNYLPEVAEGVRYVSGTFKNHGMAGFAFMFNVSRFIDPPFDESWEFWGGDDAFAHLVISSGGKIGIVEGTPIGHVGGASSSKRNDIPAMINRDVERMKKKGLW